MALIVVLAITYATWRVSDKALEFTKGIAKDFSDKFQFTPQVQIGNRPPVILKYAPILHLATVTQPSVHRYSWTQSWMGSTKVLELEGDFSCQAGFDLKKPFSLNVDPETMAVIAHLPPPELLAIEMVHYHVLKDENGWWNSITPKEREDATNALIAEARKQVIAAGILKDAQKALEQQLDELVKKRGAPSVTYQIAPGG